MVSALQDPSFIHQKIIYDMMAAMDVPASYSSMAYFYINDIYWGSYLMINNIDEDFLTERFGSDKGTLYKCFSGADLSYHGPDPETYK